MSSDKPFVEETAAWIVAGFFAFGGFAFSMYNIGQHLAHWNKPVFQLWIVRVLFIIPIYSFISFFSIRFETAGLYMEIIRDCYEAFVIYCFLIWVLNAIGGEESCGRSIASRMHMPHPPPLCCLPHIRLNANFLRVCKQFTLQFVILKPIMGTISFILLAIGGTTLYDNDFWQIVMLTLYNVSYTLALYGLFLFYIATRDEMKAHSPVKKFLAVKSIVFMTYWQSLFVPLVFGSEYADKYDDFILCCEMIVFSFLHYKAFPWWEFKYAEIELTKEIDYGHTGFSSMDDEIIKNTRVSMTNNNNNSSHLRKDNRDNLKYDGIHKSTKRQIVVTNDNNAKKTPLIGSDISSQSNMDESDMNDPDLPDDFYDTNNNSNENNENGNGQNDQQLNELYVLSEGKCTGNTFCIALCEVINVTDVFDDAYRNFKIVPNGNNNNDANIKIKKKKKHKKKKKKEKKVENEIDVTINNNTNYRAMNGTNDDDNDDNMQIRNAEMIATGIEHNNNNNNNGNDSINNNISESDNTTMTTVGSTQINSIDDDMNESINSKGMIGDMVSTMAAHKVMIGQLDTQDILKSKQSRLINNISNPTDM